MLAAMPSAFNTAGHEIWSVIQPILTAVAAVLVFLMTMLKTNPDELKSNASKYLNYFGLKRIPNFLKSKEADSVLFAWARNSLITIVLAAGVIYFVRLPPQTASVFSSPIQELKPSGHALEQTTLPTTPPAAQQPTNTPPVADLPPVYKQPTIQIDPNDTSEDGKVFSNKTVEYFYNILRSQNGVVAWSMIKPYVGTIIHFEGKIQMDNVSESDAAIFVGIQVEPAGYVLCQFPPQFHDYVARLDSAQTIKVSGRIYQIMGVSLSLRACHPSP